MLTLRRKPLLANIIRKQKIANLIDFRAFVKAGKVRLGHKKLTNPFVQLEDGTHFVSIGNAKYWLRIEKRKLEAFHNIKGFARNPRDVGTDLGRKASPRYK